MINRFGLIVSATELLWVLHDVCFQRRQLTNRPKEFIRNATESVIVTPQSSLILYENTATENHLKCQTQSDGTETNSQKLFHCVWGAHYSFMNRKIHPWTVIGLYPGMASGAYAPSLGRHWRGAWICALALLQWFPKCVPRLSSWGVVAFSFQRSREYS